MKNYDVIVIGGGPAGMAAALAAHGSGSTVLLIEREARLGGILKQCIHDGFGLRYFKERLTGPEYAQRFIERVRAAALPCLMSAFVTSLQRDSRGYVICVVSREGMQMLHCGALILATGCRERTSRQIAVHGPRPSGIFTAGTAQYMMNVQGVLPARRCVILGSGDIGLIMARRLKLEGAEVLGVYELKDRASGLSRNLQQCLADYQIPLHLSHTVTRVFGEGRLEGVELARVDARQRLIPGTAFRVDCDGLILSVGLIPENELAERLGLCLDVHTRGPACDADMMSEQPGLFVCGNALHVNDLVDYVSEAGERAGRAASAYVRQSEAAARTEVIEEKRRKDPGWLQRQPAHKGGTSRKLAGYTRGGQARLCSGEQTKDKLLRLNISSDFLYMVPQFLRPAETETEPLVVYFRARTERGRSRLCLYRNERCIFSREYAQLKPPELERVSLPAALFAGGESDSFSFRLEAVVSGSTAETGGEARR